MMLAIIVLLCGALFTNAFRIQCRMGAFDTGQKFSHRYDLQPLDLPHKICKLCKQSYTASNLTNCQYHAGRYIGAENSKHYGTKSGLMSGLSLFWDCCDGERFDSPGCSRGKHQSYDDEGENFMLINRYD